MNLTPRQRGIVDLAAEGLTVQQIAGRLFLSTHTVKSHISKALKDNGAASMTHLVAMTLREDPPAPENESEPQRVNRIMRRVLAGNLAKLEAEAVQNGWP